MTERVIYITSGPRAGHWDSTAMQRGVDEFIAKLVRTNAELREERISRHGFDCFAVDPHPWSSTKIAEHYAKLDRTTIARRF